MKTGFELKKRADFVKVAKSGIKVVCHSLILQAAFNLCNTHVHYRLGFTATKKLGKAHIRNLSKRRLRAAARDMFKASALNNADYVVIARYSTPTVNFADLCKDLAYALNKINAELKSHENNFNLSR